MTLNAAIEEKLRANATRVDRFIEDLLEPRKPEALYEASKHIIAAGGKRLRPYLVVKSCELVGGDPESAVPFASALEVLHNFTLIHDDIMDNDNIRRGAPTVHTLWGEPIAIASGDLLFAKVYQAMLEPAVNETLPFEKVINCIKRVTEATINLCEGQVLDISYPNVRDVSEEDYIFMVGGKTSALFKACAEVGAIMGGGTPDEVARLGAFAWNAGIAFQIVDDILGVTSEEETLGKPVGSDLREGKKTLILIHALERASPAERDAIEKVLGVNDAAAHNIAVAEKALRSTGGIDFAKVRAREYTENSKANLEPFPESQAKRDLLELIEFFTERAF
jgi:geranylgeranyl diphosphate synthase type I